ncbi:MAG: NADH-quinone oxidoreductase subunit NuoG [Gammaproteobacteria bacterium]|nr:NADH-quinone oxidoreductase subunit NuoG [Gammaproteobacteria bacterium]
MATIHVDGKTYEVDDTDNLLQACLSLDLDIPYFCWHPALGSVGACRQCAVKQYANANDKRGKIVMSCMTPASNGAWISIDDAEAKAFRKNVVEWLMVNHPHDCPVCEEGGNCHLQDMTVMTGHNKRSYRFDKRTHLNQDLGPFINHEMNRCIACYRCVRYYQDYAGGDDLGVFGAHDNVYFGRVESGPLENEFSGNLTEVCPTGVFTDKTHGEHYTRKWDMQFAPSICQQCSVGCNTSPGERYGEVRRIENRYNGAVNHSFLCDRGRFGYGYVNNKDRPRQPTAKQSNNAYSIINTDQALAITSSNLRDAKNIIGIGSPRASLEANFALRELVGDKNFYTGMRAAELTQTQLILSILKNSPARTPSLRDIESYDAILVLGEDVTQTAPRIALALRQAIVYGKAQTLAAAQNIATWQADAIKNIAQHEKNPLFVASFSSTKLDDIATATYRAAPEDLARLGFAIAHALDSKAPAVKDLDANTSALAQQITQALRNAKKPLIISGTGAGSTAVLHAAANITTALHAHNKNTAISLVVPETNSLGVAMLNNQSLDAALHTLNTGNVDTVIIVENDLYQRADTSVIDNALQKIKNIIVLDHQITRTTQQASMVLPTASFAESDGTLINNEMRAQRYFQVYDPIYYDPQCQIKESWRWLHALQCATKNQNIDWTQLDQVTLACATAIPALARIVEAAPDATFRVQGLKIAREPNRYSGRTAMRANLSVHEPRASQDKDSALAFSMEGYSGAKQSVAPLIPFAWVPGWNSPQAWNKFQDEVGGHSRGGDSGVRLIEPNNTTTPYLGTAPAAFITRKNEWRVLPLHHIFGSDELSARTAPIQARMPTAYVAISAHDAQQLHVLDNTIVNIKTSQCTLKLPVIIHAALASGTIGLPVLPNMPLIINRDETELWAQVIV